MQTIAKICFIWTFWVAALSLQAQSTQGKGAWEVFSYPEEFITRKWAAVAWTGEEMLYWGGSSTDRYEEDWKGVKAEGKYMPSNGFYFTDGWKINPKTGTFKKMPPSGLPILIDTYKSAWVAGRYLFVYGNTRNPQGIFKVYDNQTNAWKNVSMVGAPKGDRYMSRLLSVGDEVLIWGGKNYQGTLVYEEGYLYNPATNKWRRAAKSILSARDGNCFFWTGTEAIVWGGWILSNQKTVNLKDGAAYNPKTNQWRKIKDNPYYAGALYEVNTIWTGKECLFLVDTRGRSGMTFSSMGYNPATDTWRNVAFDGSIELGCTYDFWTGSKVIAYMGHSYMVGEIWDYTTDKREPFLLKYNNPLEPNAMLWTGDGLLVLDAHKLSVYYPEKPYNEPEIKSVAGSFTDTRDGKTYKTMTINGQTWMVGFLKYQSPQTKCYEEKSENCQKYGVLYNFEDAKTACPKGWRLPTTQDMEKLITYTGGGLYGTQHLFSANAIFNENWKGTGKTGLNWEHGGFKNYGTRYEGLGKEFHFWYADTKHYGKFYLSSLYKDGLMGGKRNADKLCYILCIKE